VSRAWRHDLARMTRKTSGSAAPRAGRPENQVPGGSTVPAVVAGRGKGSPVQSRAPGRSFIDRRDRAGGPANVRRRVGGGIRSGRTATPDGKKRGVDRWKPQLLRPNPGRSFECDNGEHNNKRQAGPRRSPIACRRQPAGMLGPCGRAAICKGVEKQIFSGGGPCRSGWSRDGPAGRTPSGLFGTPSAGGASAMFTASPSRPGRCPGLGMKSA
jgi:hypothetical protein